MGKVFRDQTAKEIEEVLVGILHQMGGSLAPKNAMQIQAKVRAHTIGAYLQPGDPITVAKASGVSATVSGSVTAAAVNEKTFIEAIGHSETGAYEFVYDGAAWTLHGDAVELSNYGITITGTPDEGDSVVIHVQADHIVFETLGIGCDVPVNSNLDNSISFLTRDVQIFNGVPTCASQALAVVTSAISSGAKAYVKGDHCCYDGTTKQDGNYGFIAPGDIPVGAKIRHSTIGREQASAENYTKAVVLAGKFTVYGADYSILYDNVDTIEDDTGVLLGTVTSRDPQYLENGTAGHVNFTQRNYGGNNSLSHSAIRKWLNSDAPGAGSGQIASWWTPSDEFDMPIVSTLPGFLYGLDPEFCSCLAKVWKRTAKSVADGHGYEDTQELVWAPSTTELGGGNNNSVVETSPKGSAGDPNFTAYPLYSNAISADLIKYYQSEAKPWLLRSPSPNFADSIRIIRADGTRFVTPSNTKSGVVAGVCIA